VCILCGGDLHILGDCPVAMKVVYERVIDPLIEKAATELGYRIQDTMYKAAANAVAREEHLSNIEFVNQNGRGK
jgi:hypothetical protein